MNGWDLTIADAILIISLIGFAIVVAFLMGHDSARTDHALDYCRGYCERLDQELLRQEDEQCICSVVVAKE